MQQVTSNEHPEQVQLLQGKKLINIDVIESVTESEGASVTSFAFTQLAVDVSTNTDIAIMQYRAEVAQKYLNDTDFYMTLDKNKQLSAERGIELDTAREEARVIIRQYELDTESN